MGQSRADIQRRYREQLKLRLSESGKEPLPSLPGVSNLPASRRWSVSVDRAKTSLESTLAEMAAYYDDRSAEWQDGEKGEAFQEKIDALTEAVEKLNDLTFS